MSFGFSPSDIVLLVQLAFNTVKNSRKAFGEYAELTREVSSLHLVSRRLQQEANKPESPINRPGDSFRRELTWIVSDCRRVLNVLEKVLEKYNALDDHEKSTRKLWQKVRFGNGEIADIAELRSKTTYFVSALSLLLNMISMGSIGAVQKQMDEAGADIKEIQFAIHDITAHLMADVNKRGQGSVLTDYDGDDKAVWREFRRELVRDGFPSSVIRKNKEIILAYVKELGSRGLLDEEDLTVPRPCIGEVGEKCSDGDYKSGNTRASVVSKFEASPPNQRNQLPMQPKPNQDKNKYQSGDSQEASLTGAFGAQPKKSDVENESDEGNLYDGSDLHDGSDLDGGSDLHDRSKSRAERKTTEPESGFNGSETQESNIQTPFTENQVNPTGIIQNDNTRTAKADCPETQEFTQQSTDQQDTSVWSALGLEFETVETFFSYPRFPPLSLQIDFPGVSHAFLTSASEIYYIIDETNLSLCLEGLRLRVNLILACSLKRQSQCRRKSLGPLPQVRNYRSLEFLDKHAALVVGLMSEMDPFLNPDPCICDPAPGSALGTNFYFLRIKSLQCISSFCAAFLQNAISRKASLGPSALQVKTEGAEFRDLSLKISKWAASFDAQCAEKAQGLRGILASDTGRLTNDSREQSNERLVQETAMYSTGSVCSLYEVRNAPNAFYQQLRGVAQILYRDYEWQWRLRNPHAPPGERSTLSRAIIENVLLKLEDPSVGESQELRTLKSEIFAKASNMLREIC